MTDSTDELQDLRERTAFELQTRDERFSRIGDTEPDDPKQVELLAADYSDWPDQVSAELMKTVTLLHVTTSRIHLETAKSLGFDISILHRIAERLLEQDREIAELRQAVEDLRRDR